jgi:hypothetical protein
LKTNPVFQSLIPLFANADSRREGYLEMLVDFLSNLTDIGQFSDFPLLAFLMKQCNPQNLTRKLYAKFSSIFEGSKDDSLV